MNNQVFRLFINNVTENMNVELLDKKLSQYGDISSIEIKQRKNVIGNQTPSFAYININTNPENIQKCFKDFSTQKFQNVFIDISIAKESFIERLKREREKKHNDKESATECSFNECSKKESISSSSKAVLNETGLHEDCSIVKNLSEENNVQPPLSVSEQKRIQSILEKKREYHFQKLLLQNALSKIDIKPKSKVCFFEDEDCMANNKRSNNEKGQQKEKFQLFTDDNDENETKGEWFKVKEHFEGVKGQKLLKLQSKFKNDPRFSMDTRFLDNDISEEENFKNKESTIENDERKIQMQILQQVLNKNEVPFTHARIFESSTKTLTGMLRYDPDHEDHLKYEMTPTSEKHGRDKKKVDINVEHSAENEYNEKPEVSNEKFYKVTDNLKDALFTGEQFSLLGTFGSYCGNKEDYNINEQNSEIVPKKKHKKENIITSNPFVYDSSSDSEDDKKDEKMSVKDIGSSKPQKLWAESFFFKNDDYRLQEGFDFVKRLDSNDPADFVKLRRNIKEAVKAKIKNNQKKFNPFKKKLGELKRIKIKRALKR